MNKSPPNAEQNPENVYTSIFVFSTGSPISIAELSLPPMAYIVLPNLVYLRIYIAAATTSKLTTTFIEIKAPGAIGILNLEILEKYNYL